MKILILSEIKRKLFSSVTFLAIFLLLAAITLDMEEANRLRESRPFSGHDMYNLSTNSLDWTVFLPREGREKYPLQVYSYNLLNEQFIKSGESGMKNEYVENSRVNSFVSLLMYKMSSLTQGPLSEQMTLSAIGDIWDEVSGGVAYEDVDFRPFFSPDPTGLPTYLLRSKYSNYLYKNEIEPVYIDENNNVAITYRYLNSILPIALLLLVILFNYNSINGDKNSGTLKLLLTQSVPRSKYYISKYVGGVFTLVTTVLIPPIVVGLLLGVKNGFVTMKYPITYLSGIATRLTPIINYYDHFNSEVNPIMHLRALGHVAPRALVNGTFFVHPEVEVIPFYQYILIAIVLLFLFAGFAVSLTQLISTLFNNEIISLMVNLLLIFLGTLISMPLTLGEKFNFSPFSMANITRIIEGTYNVTVLGAVIILILSTITLLVTGCVYFKKKAI